MNEIRRPSATADDEVLAGVRRHLAGVEAHVPLPAAWTPDARAQRVRRNVTIRAGLASGGLAVFALAAVVVVVLLGPALGLRGNGPHAGGPSGDGATVTYRAETVDGSAPTTDQMNEIAAAIEARAAAAGLRGYSVSVVPPDRVELRTAEVPSETLAASLARQGVVAVVPLPRADYGTVDSPGPRTAVVGQALPTQPTPLFDGSGIDPEKAAVSKDAADAWAIELTLKPAAASLLASYTTAHVGEFFAIVVDGAVVAAPYVRAPITEGTLAVSGDISQATAESFVATLKTQPLPLHVVMVSVATPGGTSKVVAPTALVTPAHTIEPGATPPAVPAMTRGETTAPVTLEVWIDFQCPSCGSFERDVLPWLIAEYVDMAKIRIVAHDFVVVTYEAGNTESRDAAIAARAAGLQGKYWEFAAWLMKNQHPEFSGWLTRTTFDQAAQAVGLDLARFHSDLADPSLAAAVDASSSDAAARGVNAVPTVTVNGTAVSAVDYATIKAAIDRALS